LHIDDNLDLVVSGDSPRWGFAVASGILGWVLDAFDFFVVVFLLTELMSKFHVEKSAIAWSIALTLAMRPVGALIFGAIADRFGRKRPLVACVIYFSTITILSGLAPNYTVFLILRGLYGIGMGGYWGIGASYCMESAPRSRRGVFSGMMQAGYPFGQMCAAFSMQWVTPHFGWQAMFFVGSALAALVVVLTLCAPESDAWKLHKMPSVASMFRKLLGHAPIALYLVLLMTFMSCLSHGTQDLYPDFLKTLPFMRGAHILGFQATLGTVVLYSVGAITGALIVGHLSEKLGRRYAIIAALLLSLCSIPAWAFAHSLGVVMLGAFVMQFGVQGAYGVVPAHLNELSPDAIRGLFPGFVYQLGVLVSSPILPAQNKLRERLGYPWALTVFETSVIVALLFIYFFGPEQRGRDFKKARSADAESGSADDCIGDECEMTLSID